MGGSASGCAGIAACAGPLAAGALLGDAACTASSCAGWDGSADSLSGAAGAGSGGLVWRPAWAVAARGRAPAPLVGCVATVLGLGRLRVLATAGSSLSDRVAQARVGGSAGAWEGRWRKVMPCTTAAPNNKPSITRRPGPGSGGRRAAVGGCDADVMDGSAVAGGGRSAGGLECGCIKAQIARQLSRSRFQGGGRRAVEAHVERGV
jgi:hypothetical protein